MTHAPCPVCGGTWWARKGRLFHKFNCPENMVRLRGSIARIPNPPRPSQAGIDYELAHRDDLDDEGAFAGQGDELG